MTTLVLSNCVKALEGFNGNSGISVQAQAINNRGPNIPPTVELYFTRGNQVLSVNLCCTGREIVLRTTSSTRKFSSNNPAKDIWAYLINLL